MCIAFWLFNHFLVLCFVVVRQQPPPPGPPGSKFGSQAPPGPPAFNEHAPVELESVLPLETYSRLEAIHQDLSLNWQQKRLQIEILMDSLPETISAKLPLPGNLNKLPEKLQLEIRQVLRNSSLSWKERKEAIHVIVNSLSREMRKTIEPLPLILQTQEISSTRFCPGVDDMTPEIRSKLEAAGKLLNCFPTL